MKISGRVVSTKPISLSRAAKLVSRFVAVENGSSPAVSIYLQRTSDAFNRLVQYHSKTKNTITLDSVREIEKQIINDVESDGHATTAAKKKKKKKRKKNSGSKKNRVDS
ncbi:hypothetical protein AAHA92_10189 [Salvia divinorum]|uniref:Uncharacterized protein n=1 Tax=Salvia divinorum TaxID=28513 RepID=A0ABD1HTT4_SALDI